MLRDTPRTSSYLAAIEQGAEEYFKGKFVMDVGAGSGILSLAAARAGARRVYAVEASGMVTLLSQVISANGFDEIISVCACPVENLEFPLDESDSKVDVIVSEWMGFYLLHESMLDSVLFARDKFLKPEGLLFPSTATISLSVASLPEAWDEAVDWVSKPFCGFDLSALHGPLLQKALAEPAIRTVKTEELFAEPKSIFTLDLTTLKVEELSHLHTQTTVKCVADGTLHAYVLWFDVYFPGKDALVCLSTAPWHPETHWKQSVVWFGKEAPAVAGLNLGVEVYLRQNERNKRRYDISLEISDAWHAEEGVGAEAGAQSSEGAGGAAGFSG
uniref:Protein arginine N-methyltransferase domain-containing protein n=1 Tax=Chromera velia CCMP2878 TaxID=1169474 RepID=A0A0G4ICY3_9ALVE|eukprot:Cvel_2284.t1-p1 / transcript=Cvel_2284.t1 / gene=Cvel_2284 / organism=Chromera_velia_CCMP2878 / gene_product=Probable protein arginine N-methyltransferase 6, putative / transcript_product=Probable protein arginine N-methyltransferase 6, putative / location=Cvel_scaffold88:101686-103913(-) / protein_length=329 / sequence_SO=supercontig / SO=protein_coding / is_pseudo=false